MYTRKVRGPRDDPCGSTNHLMHYLERFTTAYISIFLHFTHTWALATYFTTGIRDIPTEAPLLNEHAHDIEEGQNHIEATMDTSQSDSIPEVKGEKLFLTKQRDW